MLSNRLNIYPAIDILEGKCVRLVQGDYNQETVYDNDPVSVARKWKSMGAQFLHLVDLDGAKDGHPVNLDVVANIAKETGLPVQMGGGIRTYDDAKMVLSRGVARIILGTSILKDPEFTKKALGEFGDKVVLGFDCREGKLAVEGWQEDSELEAIKLANDLKPEGLQLVVYTDISRDGTLEGPNIKELRTFAEATGLNTIASGGISCEQDVYDLQLVKDKGVPVEGVIIGKALYTNKVQLDKLLHDIELQK